MSIPLRLSVRRQGTTYTYDDASLLARSLQTQVQIDGLEVNVESLSLSVGPKPEGFAGYTDPIGLPHGKRHRAKVERTDTGVVLLNGAIVLDDLEYDYQTGSWEVLLVNEASRDFWGTLEQTYWGEIDQFKVNSRSVLIWLRYDLENSFTTTDDPDFQSDDPEFRTSTWTAYQVRDVLDEMFRQLGYSRDLPTNIFAESDGTFDDKDYGSNVYLFISRWRLSRILRQVCGYAGFRIIPSYESFPSTDIHVELAPTTYALTGAELLDEKATPEEYRMRTESPEFEALRLANGVAPPSPNVLDYGLINATDEKNYDTTIEERFVTFASAPAWALHGSSEWRADPSYRPTNTRSRADSRTFREQVEELKLEIPPCDIERELTSGWEGRPLLEADFFNGYFGYDASEGLRPPQSEKAYLIRVGGYVSAEDAYYAVWGDVDSTYDGNAKAEHWIRQPFNQQPQRREVQRKIRGRFIGAGDYRVGTRDGVELEGSEWIVEEDRRTIGEDHQQLELRRPASDRSWTLPTVDPPLNPPSSDWNVLRLRGLIVTIDRGGGKEDWLLAHWERTATESCREYKYQVDYVDEDGNTQSEDVFATAFAYQLAAAGNGGVSYNGRDVTVTPIGDGVTGTDETVTATRN